MERSTIEEVVLEQVYKLAAITRRCIQNENTFSGFGSNPRCLITALKCGANENAEPIVTKSLLPASVAPFTLFALVELVILECGGFRGQLESMILILLTAFEQSLSPNRRR